MHNYDIMIYIEGDKMQYNFNNWNVDLIQEPNKLLKKLTEFNLKVLE